MDQPSLSSSPGSAPVSPWAPQLPPSAPEPPAPSPLKKFLPLLGGLILVIILGLLIFKVFLPKVQKPQEVTLNYWGLWETESVVSGVLADWQKTHPNIKINYSRQSPKEYRERLQSALARNEGPDIFRFHISWMPMLKNELAPVPPEVLSSSQFESGFYPVAKDNLKVGTGFLGIPLEVDTLALFINNQIFKAAGKNSPASWDELRKLALELTTKNSEGKIQTAGVALGTTNNVEHWSDILGLMMLQNGADPGNPSGQLAEDALTFYTIFNTTDRVWDETMPNSTLAFATGKVAMYLGFSWDVFEIKNINPKLDFQIAPVPQLPGTDLTWASFWVEGVSKKSKNAAAAWEFMKFLSSPQTMEKLYQAESQIRLFGEPYSRVEMASLLTNNQWVAPFVNQATKAKTWYLSSRTFDNGLNDRMIKYFEDAVNAVNLGKSAKESLATAAQGVSQLLSQYGVK